MLKTLKIFNFQAHQKLVLDLASDVTTIKGPSDVGKSAVIRALRWLCLNDISGDGFISRGAEEAVAILELREKDGRAFKIVRRKGKENLYKLDGEVFRAFGANNVPDSISRVLQLSEVNFQGQHDFPFWLGERNAGEVSRQLNAVIDLSIIDQSVSKIGSALRSAREKASVSGERLREKKAKLESLAGSEARIKKFDDAKSKWDRAEKASADFGALKLIIETAESYDLPFLENREAAAKELYDKASLLRKIASEEANLRVLAERIEAETERAGAVPDFSPVESAWEELSVAESEELNLSELVSEIESGEAWLADQEKRAKALLAGLSKIQCPTCGAKKSL